MGCFRFDRKKLLAPWIALSVGLPFVLQLSMLFLYFLLVTSCLSTIFGFKDFSSKRLFQLKPHGCTRAPNLFVLHAIQSDTTSDSSSPELNASDLKGAVVSCETTGSCGSTRRAFKQELNDIRDQKRLENRPMEDNYLYMISGNKAAAKASYSPFKRQTPPTPKPSV